MLNIVKYAVTFYGTNLKLLTTVLEFVWPDDKFCFDVGLRTNWCCHLHGQ